jgi:hypothetical protein
MRPIAFGLAGLITLLIGANVAADELKPLLAPGRGTLKGRVVWDGPLPDVTEIEKELNQALERIPEDLRPKDGRIEQQVWKINRSGGVGNVLVCLLPPPGFYFPMDRNDLDPMKAGWSKEVVLDATDFVFRPHLSLLFPKGRDADGKSVATGQVFKIKPHRRVVYNVAIFDRAANDSLNYLISPGDEPREIKLAPSPMLMPVGCNIYPWMHAWIRVFDHPYAVLTDTDGNFEIRNVPAGVKVQVLAWHEGIGWLTPNGKLGDTIEVPVGKVLTHPFKARLRE